MLATIVAVSVLFGVSRFVVPGRDVSWPGTYEAFAHIWVGMLIGFAVTTRFAHAAWWSLGVITAIETVMFFVNRNQRRRSVKGQQR